jgi:hypothetical protein
MAIYCLNLPLYARSLLRSRIRRCSVEATLIDSQQAVYEAIRDLGPIQGPDICRHAGVELSNLKNKILPALRERFPTLKNKPGAGYFIP